LTGNLETTPKRESKEIATGDAGEDHARMPQLEVEPIQSRIRSR